VAVRSGLANAVVVAADGAIGGDAAPRPGTAGPNLDGSARDAPIWLKVEDVPVASEFLAAKCERLPLGKVCENDRYCRASWQHEASLANELCGHPPTDEMMSEVDMYGTCGGFHVINLSGLSTGRTYFYNAATGKLTGAILYHAHGGQFIRTCYGDVPQALPRCRATKACTTG
jgi:hypothetical protein